MDESTLVLRDTGVYVWVRRGESTPEKEITSLRAAVHVWGAIWNEGAVFAQYSGHLSGEKYIEILEENLLRHRREFKGKTFLHDQASFHRSNIVKALVPYKQIRCGVVTNSFAPIQPNRILVGLGESTGKGPRAGHSCILG